jgi:Zn-dependent membrane protease YugP
MYFDWTYLLVIVGIVLSMIASSKVKNTFVQYSKVYAVRGMTGAQAAQYILRQEGITDVTIGRIAGNLTDHYDPRSKTLRLSDTVYGSTSVSAISVAAHECGHAVQDAQGYLPLALRTAIVPVANFGGHLSWPLVILGIILGGIPILIKVGVLLFAAVVAFHLITLPVEFNASSRALKGLEASGILQGEENTFARKVLGAAALTYVASAAAMSLQFLRLLLLTRGYRRD